jgi:hypothetical protein
MQPTTTSQDRTDRMIEALYRIIHQAGVQGPTYPIERLRTAKAVLRRLTQEQEQQHEGR